LNAAVKTGVHVARLQVDVLVSKGIITEDQLRSAQQESSKTGLSIEKSLERLGYITEAEIVRLYADAAGVPFIDLADYLIDADVIKLIPEIVAKKYNAVPLFKIGDALTVAMADPQDIIALDEIRARSGVLMIDAMIATPDAIQKTIDQYYGAIGSAKELVAGLTPEKFEKHARAGKGMAEIVEEAPVIRLVNLLIAQAVKDRASDIHIEPAELNVLIRYRVDGILHEIQQIPKHLQSALVSRIKVMGHMDIAQTRSPQDGRIQLKMEGKNLDLRVSSFPTVNGENVVIRILDKSSVILGLGELGLSDGQRETFEKLIRHPNGIILVTGPTGSGKTTTLSAALSTINSIEKNIITIEDPVEYEIPLIRQTQVNPKAGITFANGLRSILRQDPDIIMVGEIRDRETAEVAIQASLTGHLVLSTLHTNDAASSLTRLIDMGVEPFLISTSVIGILAQRLVRVICPKCKAPYVPSQTVLEGLHVDPSLELYRGTGCMHCKNSGYIGRIGIFELLVVDEAIKNLIVAKMPSHEVRKKAVESGMLTLYEGGIEKIKKGITTAEEVLRVIEEM